MRVRLRVRLRDVVGTSGSLRQPSQGAVSGCPFVLHECASTLPWNSGSSLGIAAWPRRTDTTKQRTPSQPHEGASTRSVSIQEYHDAPSALNQDAATARYETRWARGPDLGETSAAGGIVGQGSLRPGSLHSEECKFRRPYKRPPPFSVPKPHVSNKPTVSLTTEKRVLLAVTSREQCARIKPGTPQIFNSQFQGTGIPAAWADSSRFT